MTPAKWIALWVVYIVWGSTYLAIAVVIETLPPFLSASVRWLVAGSLMLAFVAVRRGFTQRPTAVHWRNAAVVGVLLVAGGNGLVSLAEQRITSGMAALLVALVPLLIGAFDALASRKLPHPVVMVGLLLGFAGVAILVSPRQGAGAVDTAGALLVVGAATAWAAGSVFAGRVRLPQQPLVATGMEMLCGAAALIVMGLLHGEAGRFDLFGASRASLIALGYLIVFGSLITFTAYTWLLRTAPTAVTATYAYVNPIVAVALGALIRSEAITPTTILGGAVIVAAVMTIVTFGQRRTDVLSSADQIPEVA